jgi:hypothetical protein
VPKLNDDVANQVNEAESTGGVMEEGIYEMYLKQVDDQKDGKPLMGEKGPYWNWTFVVPEDAERYKNWNQWLITSLSESAAFKLKEVFAAFGVSPDTDTDELIGKRVRVEVGVRTIQKGARAGEVANQVKTVYPLDEIDAQVAKNEKAAATSSKARY